VEEPAPAILALLVEGDARLAAQTIANDLMVDLTLVQAVIGRRT
jgi:hypothetical protein